MTVAKSAYTSKTKIQYNKANSLIINKSNVVTNLEDIEKIIEADEKIDLDKIKKYFENVINEKHFLANYGKAKARTDNALEETMV